MFALAPPHFLRRISIKIARGDESQRNGSRRDAFVHIMGLVIQQHPTPASRQIDQAQHSSVTLLARVKGIKQLLTF